jgi:hypothetical protein
MSLVKSALEDVSFDLGWSLIERFAVLVRESGSTDERAAAHFIVSRLDSLGIPYDLHEPKLYVSVPRSGAVEVAGITMDGKPPSFSASTGSKGLTAEPVHVPATTVRGGSDLFKSVVEGELPDLQGKVVVTEGYAMPVSVARFEAAGAAGQIYINPGSRVHWGICTSIWGAPSEAQLERKPSTPVVAINRTDGNRLLEAIEEGTEQVTLHTELTEGWSMCPVPVARIEGQNDEFVLVHGHYDSWDIGIGDNAVGDATLLELARIFHARCEEMPRSLRVAWWPAHSTGRYGGSTWYADNMGLELHSKCVAAVNIDSPGCWRATRYDEVAWMAETEDVSRSSIKSVTGIEPGRQRPLRAGDYSFNQLGISSFYMLLSNIPEEERDRRGFYPVGGCGGNIAWHTEKDRIDVADRANLERDLRVYVTAISEFITAEILPLDFRKTAAELDEALSDYETKAFKRFDLSAVRKSFDAVNLRLEHLYSKIEAGELPADVVNDLLLRLGRILVPIGYAEGPRFEHDPATPRVPIPRLAKLHELESMEEGVSERLPFVLTELRRHANEVAQRLLEAVWLLDLVAPMPEPEVPKGKRASKKKKKPKKKR